MANIAFFLDMEEGHYFPTFPLARELARRGHEITYLGFPRAASVVRSKGFRFVPIFSDIAPAGRRSADGLTSLQFFEPLVTGKALDRAVAAIQPDLFLTLSIFCTEGLVLKYRYDVPVALIR